MILLMLIVFGLCAGSFVNALVWRIHEQEIVQEEKFQSDTEQKSLSILTGRSMCPDCRHELAPWDLIPVFSWLLLRGRCRYCRKGISAQYPLVELITSLFFVLSYIFSPFGHAHVGVFEFTFWLIFLPAFVALFIYDLRWLLLPDRIVFFLIGLAVLELVLEILIFKTGLHSVLYAIVAAGCLSGLFFALHVFSKGTWIGFGDVKLAIVLGLLAGTVPKVLLLLFLAAGFGTLVAVPMLIRGKATAKTQLPFGPFLLISAVVVVLFGGHIVSWYTNFFQLG